MISPASIARLCRGTLTPLPDYCWHVAERFAAGMNEQPGTVADTTVIFEKIKLALRRFAWENPASDLADYINDNIDRATGEKERV